MKLFFVFITGMPKTLFRFRTVLLSDCQFWLSGAWQSCKSSRLLWSLAVSTCLFGASNLSAQQDIPLEVPPLFEQITSPYGVILTSQNVITTMRDETPIALDLYRPDDDAQHPTLYAAGPYPHSEEILYDTGTEAGNIAWFVSQGYAVVVASVRGTGSSGGDYSFLSREEQQDHYEVIEWIAEQSWSDGQVAGTGAGYYASAQWQMAIQNPPHLSCIAPINGSLDPLREWVYPGGLSNNSFVNSWYDKQVRLANAYSREAPRLVNYDLRLEQLSHQQDDSYWRIRSSLESASLINVPVFAINNWRMDDLAPGVKNTIKALDQLNVVNKILISNVAGDTPQHQDTTFLARELLPYYEWCFSDRSSNLSFIELPRIRYFVNGQNIIKPESSWPPGNVAHEVWFLNNPSYDNNTDITALPASLNKAQQSNSVPVSSFIANENSDNLIRYVSPPLTENLEIAGSVMLELYASSTTSDMAFEVILREEISAEPQPEPVLMLASFLAPVPVDETLEITPEPRPQVNITTGKLKASARERLIDDETENEYSPDYSLSGPQLLQPGQIYRLDIALRDTAYRFSAGNRIVLEIKPVDDGSLNHTDVSELLYHNQQYPSALWLPVARNRQQLQEATNIPVSQTTPPAAVNVDVVEEEEESLSEETLQFFVPQ